MFNMDIVIATKNADKFKEFVNILGRFDGVCLKALKEFPNAPDVAEDGKGFEENAAKKAFAAARFTKCIALADDSGLEVKYLNGAPGIFSSRFTRKGATYKYNNKKLLRLLKGIPQHKRLATFRCAIAVADTHRVISVVQGICKGRIAFEERGSQGFGYDPVFIPLRSKKTFAEMNANEKDKISHRAQAIKKAKRIILDLIAKECV